MWGGDLLDDIFDPIDATIEVNKDIEKKLSLGIIGLVFLTILALAIIIIIMKL